MTASLSFAILALAVACLALVASIAVYREMRAREARLAAGMGEIERFNARCDASPIELDTTDRATAAAIQRRVEG